MTLLVTGAGGHVGGEVVRQTSMAGEPVVALYHTPDSERAKAGSSGSVVSACCDIADLAAIEDITKKYSVTGCIHLAAVSNEKYARPQPLTAIRSNVGAPANLLDLARLQKWRRFIHVSTGSVFQKAGDISLPIYEDAIPSVTDIYSTTKYCGELLTRMYRTQFEMPAAVVRISWVYGPPVVMIDPSRGPIPAFLRRALAGIEIREPGADFAASFTYVGDVAKGLRAAYHAPQLNYDVYHLGYGVNFTTSQVADAVRAAVPGCVIELGSGTEPWTKYTRIRGPLAGDRLHKDTGFKIEQSLNEGVRAYADWMRKHPELIA